MRAGEGRGMMHTENRLTVARIDLDAIRSNAAILAARLGGFVADVSADAYGHGATAVSRAALDGGASSVSKHPFSGTDELYGFADDPRLRAAMRVSALVVGVKTIEAGDGVSYGYTWRASVRTNLALVGIGYADGVNRSASNVGSLLLGGLARRIVGRVAMNALVLELGDDEAKVGDEAVVYGDRRDGEPSISSWANAIGSSAAEVASVFGAHAARVLR